MAVSKTGGTKGKLRGQVGNTVYQVRRNDDGTYTQVLYQKGERVETETTPKLQAQRMYTAMVESLMKELKPVGRISMQSGKNKSQSLNAFSSWNLRMVANDAKAHWYGNQAFVYPRHYRTTMDIQDLGGPYIISSGSLNYDLFSSLLFEPNCITKFLDITDWNLAFFGMMFDCRIAAETVSSFMARHKMTRLDTMGYCGFRSWLSYEPNSDDPQTYMKHEYFLVKINLRLDGELVMTPDIIRELFEFSYSLQPQVVISRDGLSFGIGWLLDLDHLDDQLFYHAGFSISYVNGKKAISSHQYENPVGGAEPWLMDAQPSKVFGSWMGDPTNPNYPSPYE